MPYAVVLVLGRAQAWLADRFRASRNYIWTPPWLFVRMLFLVAAWARYGRGWYHGLTNKEAA